MENRPRRIRVIIIIIILKGMLKAAINAEDVNRFNYINSLTAMLDGSTLETMMQNPNWGPAENAVWAKIEDVDTEAANDCDTHTLKELANDLESLLNVI